MPVASTISWHWVALLLQLTYCASLCVCKNWGSRAEWAVNCAWLAFHTEWNSWGVTLYSVEGINFSQISLFPFFLRAVFSFLPSPLLLFSACLSLLSSFFLCLSYLHSRLFPFLLSFISCLPLFSFFPFPSCLSLSLFLCHLPFVSLLRLLFRLSPVCLCAFAKLRKAVNFVLSVRPHGKTRLQLKGYLLNLTFEYFPKVCREVKCDWNLTRTITLH
jgi:hypothetical protein